EFDRCSYCGLPAFHTSEEIEKYKQTLPGIKSKDHNIWASLGSAFFTFVFSIPRFALILVGGFMAIIPFVKDNMLIAMPVALALVFFV
ncbi:MAG TPA: hypothetical protein VFY83_12410, partial [Anaerolineales bacterium]|nr:hypothetical protein [Anaerolineales bacterium]